MAIAGSNLVTLSDVELDLTISVPAEATSFEIGIFDGDSGNLDLLGVSHWDTGVLAVYDYTLYADPNANGAGSTVIDLIPGSPSVSSNAMPDNAWIDFTIPTGPEAATPGGNYFYRLNVKLTVAALTTVNAFKIRSNAVVSGVTLDPTVRPFSYIANLRGLADIQIVHPAYPSATPTSYDGSFNFFFDIPVTRNDLTIWDGDFDRGKFDGTDLDTDDPDTPNAPFLPAWATEDALSESATSSNPADDRNPAGTGIYNSRPPSVQYRVVFPDGQTFLNTNPSGNQEWEQFRISTEPFDPTQMDYSTFEIPPGTYEFQGIGVDMQNLNALLLPFRVLCVDEEGVPCTPLRPYKIGDTVFADENGNGVQDLGEPGIEGVSVLLFDQAGFFLESTTTDENGEYFFFVEAYSYLVQIDPANSSSEDGTLRGYDPTTPEECEPTITNDNYLDCDFGYRPPARIGDRVWLDFNGDGVQDPGEPGLNGVSVELLDADGNVVSSETTGGDGNYTFLSVQPGTYTVRIDASFLPGGLDPTFDRDGIATPHEASVTVAGGQTVFDVDFGYRGTGSLGDRLWLDANGNGAQDPGEGGLNGVTVRLFDYEGNPFATAVTAGDGNYTFTGLFEANYTVQVDASTLPAGLTATYDFDGIASLDTVELTLGAGENRTDIDFGYRGDASVGDRVWSDANADGIQDPGEAGLNGVTVQLLDGAANVVATTVTAGDGDYNFSNLAAGSYTVRVDATTLPAGAAPTFDADGIATPNVTAVTLAAGTTRTDVDFGYRSGSSLGDRLWYDLDGDGIQEAGEGGINGVTVQLLDGAANVLATAVTSGDGEYTFPNLAAGTYTVRVDATTLPAGLAPTYDLDGVATPNTATVTLAGGDNRTDVDFGYRGNASIGDRLWADANADGIQDAGENGINGVTVELLDSAANVLATTTTSGDGNYTFENLLGGEYRVRVIASSLPAGLAPSYDLDGIATANTTAVTLATGDARTDVDFGYRGTAALGDRLWYDANGNGTQDAGENGLNGVTVELLDSAANVILTTITSGDGNYNFNNLLADTYTVRVVASSLPAGLAPTYDLDGIATANTASVTLAAGTTRDDVDFGYRGTASIGDRLWNDVNGNGTQDAGETGINGVTVELLDSAANVVATTTTSGDGNYGFDNLETGNYTVRVVASSLPAGVAPTYDLDGIATANTAAVTLAAGATRDDVDFGYRGTASIGDRLWTDANGNGIQDAGETGINGVTVELLSGADVVASTTTSGDGNYSFANLGAGTYTVRVVASSLPAGLAPTYDLDGIATANTASVTLAAGATRDDVDFGYRGTASLGDRLWYDANGNGIQDAGENGLNGVTVELLSGTDVVATTTTSGDGIYGFANLGAGTYTVRVVASSLPAGLAPTYDLDGIASANTAAVTLAAGATRDDVDFGYRGTASLGDRLWYDANGNGIQDAGENGLNGVTVELLSGADVVATTTTSGDGIYGFANLAAGNYTVRVVASSLPAGLAPTYDLDGIATANTASLTLAAGATRDDVDFGYRGTASLGDRLWYDANGNGIQDAGENGLNGVTVELLSGADVVATTTTSGDGNYGFANLAAGNYTVRVVASSLPAGLAPTYDLDGIATANTASLTLAAGATRNDVDFGYRGTASLGDRLWYDADGDGIQDAGENGLNGVTVELLSGADVVATTTTSGDGNYGFANLAAGNYTVRVVASSLPAGLAPTYDLDGIATANTASLTLAAGATRNDVDFGYRGTASLGDRLWYDADGDGIQDAGENGLNGVTVELLSGADVVATTTTSGDGNYGFANLAAGNYTVRVVASSLPAGLAPTYDLDGIATANTASLTLAAGATRNDVDFGYRGTASLGDRLWYDADGDGIQDAGENGLNGVTVELLSGADVVATTTTSGDGNYGFANLAAGNYTVRVVASSLPAGLAPTYDLDGIATANTASVTLTAGANRNDVDFGYRGTASLGDRLWYDADADGVQDAGEAGINGVTVELLSGATVVASTTTSGDGNYGFSNLAAGSYTVRAVAASLPAGVAPTYDLDGIATANTATVTLTAGATRNDVDFGYRGTGSIGDRLWNDADGDGIQDAGEAGINGVTVELLSGATVVATTTTSGDGNYGFSNLAAGSYTVRVVAASLPAGVAPTYDLDGIATANTASVTLTAGATRDDVDFGYRGTGSIGDRLWNDADGDGIQDAGEAGINGVTVELLSGAIVVATTTTSGDGIYGFNNLGAGTYTVRVVASSLPAGLAPTYDLDGIATANTASVTLAAGATRNDVDFGYRGNLSVGDRVWNDTDGDGVQDAGETGLTGVTVEILSGATVVATTTTGANGIYTFNNLAAGTYTVRVVASSLPAGVAQTYDLDGVATANAATFTLNANRTDVDFGYRGNLSVGDRVWNDTDGDGVQDAGETGLTGVTVELLSGATVVATTTTGANGIYTFNNLAAGTYTVRVVASSLPAGYAQTYDLDGVATANAATFTLNANRTDVDFGYRGNGSIGDRLWSDADGDGVQDAGEPGLTGVTVELVNSGGTVIATTTTGANGIYTFNNLAAGSYTVRVVSATLPAGSAPTFDLDGTGTPNTAAVTLTAGQNRTDVDFGYRGNGSIGDRLWYDADGDGVQDAGEPGLDGTMVELLNSGGTVIATTTAGANGVYTFTNLLAGSYTVRVVTASFPVGGLAPTYDLDGTGTAHTATVTLAAGQNRTDVDFGYRGTRSVGDRVWKDTDGDGVQDAGETGINGVTVRLFLGATEVASTVTTGDGNYTFPNLPEATFTVRIDTATLPAGMTPTYDLDGIATPHQATFNLTASRTDVDFGYRVPPVTCTEGYFKDHFSTASFSNNDGTRNWTGSWIESDSAGAGVNSGNVTVGNPVSGYMILRDYPDTGTQPSVAREANLTGFTSATLSFDFHVRTGIDPDDAVVVEISNNGGSSYTVLETLNGFTGTFTGSRSYNISAYMASNTRIRFRVANGYGASDEYFKLDWVRIDGDCEPAPATGSIGNRVWLDTDNDGAQDSGEAGINGVTVQLFNSAGTMVATATTAGDGNYTFSNLAAGSYSVRIVTSTLPAGAVQTYDLDGTGTAHAAAVTLTAGQNRTDVDFGYRIPPASCTPGYFKDHFNTKSFSNNDGTLDWAAAWVEYDTAGAGVNSGNVTVGNPVNGYLILRDSPDTGTQPSAARQADLSGFTMATLSFDFHVRATDPDDAVVIEVSKNGGSSYTVLETLTGFTGNDTGSRTYNISSFISSNTRIRFRISNNYGASDEYFKVDWVKIDASCGPATQNGSIGNRVWLDTDGDGAQDSGEAGINGVNVQLLNGSTVVATATTAGDGNYTFSGLAAGNYSVRIVTSTLPAGAVQTYDLDGTGTAHVAVVTLTNGQARTDVDFGYRIPPASCTAGYFKDHFSTASFSNNDGSLSWAGAWIESDSAGAGVNSGNVTVGNPVSGYLILNDSPDTGTQPSAARQANLTGFVAATLSFDFHVRAVDTDDAAVIEISKDGGATYTVLETFTNLTGNQTGSRSYNISSYIASNTRIRFRISKNYGADDEYFKIDWVKIDGSCPTTTTAPGTGTIGYWKNHPEDWPVQTITLGGRSYTKDQAIEWMETSSRGDKTIDLFKQLVAAKLNVIVGNASGCISSTISSADSWLVSNPLGSNVRSNSSAWSTGGPLHETLDDYNNGLLCAPHRD